MDLQRATAQSFRENQADHLDAVADGAHVAITRWGATAGVVIPPEVYERAMYALRLMDGLAQLSADDFAELRSSASTLAPQPVPQQLAFGEVAHAS